MEETKVRMLPNSKDAEMIILGSMIVSNDNLRMIADCLSFEDFYYEEHKIIFKEMSECSKAGRFLDAYLLCERLKEKGVIGKVGGAAYIAALDAYSGHSSNLREYCLIVRNKSLLRSIILSSKNIEAKTWKFDDAEKLLDEAQETFHKLSNSLASPMRTIAQILDGDKKGGSDEFLSELKKKIEAHALEENVPKVTGIPTFFKALDEGINGLGRSNLIILAARPAMGKTALALNIAHNVCFKAGHAVGIFSLEMSARQIAHRLVCSYAGIDADRVCKGNLRDPEHQRVINSVGDMKDKKIIIDDQGSIRLNELKSKARRMKERFDVQLIVIDYMQLLSMSGRSESRNYEISEISRALKGLAKELNIPIICLSQLSRKVEDRVGHRPLMSDLRDSGSIEADADVVLLLFRREYYDPNDKPGKAELIVGKNRHGEVRTHTLNFHKETATFSE